MTSTNHKPVLIVIAGPNGSGKTTKSIDNCGFAAEIADRTYIYDNSTDGVEAKILYRMTDGKIAKQYTTNIPEWAKGITNGQLE